MTNENVVTRRIGTAEFGRNSPGLVPERVGPTRRQDPGDALVVSVVEVVPGETGGLVTNLAIQGVERIDLGSPRSDQIRREVSPVVVRGNAAEKFVVLARSGAERRAPGSSAFRNQIAESVVGITLIARA